MWRSLQEVLVFGGGWRRRRRARLRLALLLRILERQVRIARARRACGGVARHGAERWQRRRVLAVRGGLLVRSWLDEPGEEAMPLGTSDHLGRREIGHLLERRAVLIGLVLHQNLGSGLRA